MTNGETDQLPASPAMYSYYSYHPYYSHYSYCDSADAGRCSWRRWLVQLQRQTCNVASVSCLVRVLPSPLLRQSQSLPIKGTLGWWLMIQQIGQRWNPVRAKPSTTTEWQRLPSGRDQRWAMNVKAPKMVTENQRQRSDGQQAPRFMACGTTRFSTSSSYSSKKGFHAVTNCFYGQFQKRGRGTGRFSVELYLTSTYQGGVGKTTLTYHLATHYAKTHPGERVLVIDMCPQANISSALLGELKRHQEKILAFCVFKSASNNFRGLLICLFHLRFCWWLGFRKPDERTQEWKSQGEIPFLP